MPPRSNPTARQERLGSELRKLREAAGVTAREAAALLGSGATQVSHLEAGRFGVSEERIRRLAAHYACGDRAFVDELVEMANERGQGWWEEYRGVLAPRSLDLAELEHHARYLRQVEVMHIPGLLQLESYMRAIFGYSVPELPASELEPRLAYRLRRQEVLAGAAVPYEAVIHEAALRIKVGSAKVGRAQLERLLNVSELGNVTVRVIPFDVEGFAGSGYAMLYAGGPVPELDTVQLDTAHGSLFLDAAPQLRKYRSLYEKIVSAALPAAKSRDFIHRIAQEM
ncbi:helix-turn-helix domain-containing protein [Streptomyces sp. NBC_00237]|uniref:helix-turn-helix domain-containing protein n=1 Tax=Streptomyces sp. NBC_00237 TaxID=2975687 RepID=UPI00225B9D08|nr:helix-turn-helix transcriptional regulator [Streptomyces sp. NBC_00237]MCX5204131.1 helix-turn-helix domain-containing protein [Streptomyces sp. NBC_00237]